jgi:von Willebrand factor type A domain/FHA domain
MRSLSVLGAAGAVLAALAAHCAGAPADAIHAGPVYTASKGANGVPAFPELRILVEVPAAGSDPIRPQDFWMSVDGGHRVAATSLQSLASTHYGMAMAVALDVSGSMKGAPLNAVRAGLVRFVSEAAPEDRLAIVTVADDTRWDSHWNDSRDQVRASLSKLSSRGSLTRLWDALLEILERFPEDPIARRVVVISDGHDEGSRHSEEEVIAAAVRSRIQIDSIGITRSRMVYLQSLERLSEATGGHYRMARNLSELENLVGTGIQRLKALPVATFQAPVAGDGKSHNMEVIWQHNGADSNTHLPFQAPLQQVTTSHDSTGAPAGHKWTWIAGISAGALLIVVSIVFLVVQSRRTPAAPAPTPPVAEAKMPAATPGISQSKARSAPEPAPAYMAMASSQALAQPAAAKADPGFDTATTRPQTRLTASFPQPQKGHPAAWLVCESGSFQGQAFPVDVPQFWIGALENNHLPIPDDPTISGNHACIVFDHDVLRIYDYHSTNGTVVNGAPVGESRRLLRPGDRIRIGRSTFALRSAERKKDLP